MQQSDSIHKINLVKGERNIRTQSFNVILYIFYIIFGLSCIYPFYYLIINSISDGMLVKNHRIIFLPGGLNFNNYINIFQLQNIPNSLFISVAKTILGTISVVLVSAFLGFLFTQGKMWCRRIWYRGLILTMYFGAGLIPLYMVIYHLGLLDNFLIYILPGLVSPFFIILVKTYIESIPKELQESAEISGAGPLRVFSSIIFPLLTPILATIAIFTAVGQWNDFGTALIYITNQNLFPLQFILWQYINQAASLAEMARYASMAGHALDNQDFYRHLSPEAITITISVISIVPIMMVYPFFQRFYVKGIMLGSVKG